MLLKVVGANVAISSPAARDTESILYYLKPVITVDLKLQEKVY